MYYLSYKNFGSRKRIGFFITQMTKKNELRGGETLWKEYIHRDTKTVIEKSLDKISEKGILDKSFYF